MENWKLKFGSNSGGKGINVYIHNETIECLITVPVKYLDVFGYCVAGCELGIIGKQRFDNFVEQNITMQKIVNEHLAQLQKDVDYITIRDYFNNEYKFKSKVEKDSVKRTLDLIKEEYQKLTKVKIEYNKEEIIKLRLLK
jgi:hypothetical protein